MLRFTALLFFCLSAYSAYAQKGQEGGFPKQAVENWLRGQLTGIPGEISIEINTPPSGSRLAPCSNLSFSRPQGASSWGRSYVLVQCLDNDRWRINVPVHIRVKSEYYVAVRPISSGQVLSIDDIAPQTGDLSELPPRTVTDPGLALGKVAAVSISAGSPVRTDMLKAMTVIRQGQSVKVVSRGSGFEVVNEGRALGNAAEGQLAHVKMGNGQVVSGIARFDGSIEIRF